MLYLPCAGLPRAMRDSTPRSLESHGALEGLGAPGGMMLARLVGEFIKFSGLNVPLQLAVPRLPLIIKEPIAEFRELLWREFFHLLFKSFDSCHDCCPRHGSDFTIGRCANLIPHALAVRCAHRQCGRRTSIPQDERTFVISLQVMK